MFSRISYDEFQLLFPVIGFFLFAAVFLGAVIRVALMKKPGINHLSAMPLEDEFTSETHTRRNGSLTRAPLGAGASSMPAESLPSKS